MSKFRAIVLTAVICLPIGALTQRQASAQRPVEESASNTKHFEKAESALREARFEILASQRANEDLWRDDGSHAKPVKEAIQNAVDAVERAAAWASPSCDFCAVTRSHRLLALPSQYGLTNKP